jgi:5-deoxy-glucuronate isomerase
VKITQKEPFKIGYNSIVEMDGIHKRNAHDYGILKLTHGTRVKDSKLLECAVILVYGEINVTFNGHMHHAKRDKFSGQ